MSFAKQMLAAFLSVFIVMVIVYIIKRVGSGIPVIDNVVREVF